MSRTTRASPCKSPPRSAFRAALAIGLCVAAGAAGATSSLCASSGNNQSYEWVSRVSIAGTDVSVARTGYQDSTGATIAQLQAGQTYPVQVDVHTDGSTYQEYVKLWFDLDQSGSIDNSTELVFDQNASFAGFRTYSGTVTIPSGAFNGPMDVRMIMQYAASPALCGTYSFGTTVDLRVDVSGGVDNPAAPVAPTDVSAIAGNGMASVSFTPPSPVAQSYQVVSTPGGIVATGTGSPIAVSGLTNGTSYTFTVASKSGALVSGPSAASNAVTPGAPSITFSTASLAAGTYATAYSQGVSASGGVAPYSFAVTAGALPPGVSLSPTGTLSGSPTAAGNYSFTITATDSSSSSVGGPFSGSQSVSLVIDKAQQSIVFGAAPALAYGGSGTIVATGGGSGNPVVVTSLTPGTCSLSGSMVNAVGAGACSLGAQQAGDANYEAAPDAQLAFTIAKAAQQIAFQAPRVAVLGNAPLVASGGPSGNPVQLTSATPATCKVEGDRVYSIAGDVCSIVAFQAGSSVYQDAGPTAFAVTPFYPEANLTGLWWHPAEPGWGITLNHQDNTLFATLFIYGDDGTPTWLVAPDARWDGVAFTGTLYRTAGSPFDRMPWQGMTGADPVGDITLTFSGPDKGTVRYSYQVGGVAYRIGGVVHTATRDIEQMVFGDAKPTCVSSTGSRAAERVFQDQWWDPHESGWGLDVAHQGNTLFATLFTYDDAGKPTWIVAPGMQRQPDGSYAGDLVQTASLPRTGEAWPGFTSLAAGSMRLSFGDGDVALLEYTLRGRGVRKWITRQVFGETVPACR